MFPFFLIFTLSERINSKSLQLPGGLIIDPSKDKGYKPCSSGYFFAYSSKPNFLEKIRQLGIKVSSANIINTKWILIYLTKDEIEKLNNALKLRFYDIPPLYKLKDRIEPNKTYKVRFHDKKIISIFPKLKIISNTTGIFRSNDMTKRQINKLLKNKNVLSIKLVKNFDFLNRWSAPFLQNGEEEATKIGDYMQIKRTLTDMGINGNNQIITLADTGIDTNSPFFIDENAEVPFNKFNLSHRKIIRYDTIGNNRDRNSGHGTHIAGIIAGDANASSPLSLYNGIAPKSKLYFIDIGISEMDDSSDADYDPESVVKNMKQAGSHIFSSSFGYSIENTEFRSLYDELSAKHKDILFIFACGNKGSNFSIYQPSGSKNVLSIGGATQPLAGKIENPTHHKTWLSFGDTKIELKPNSIYPDLWTNYRLKPSSSLLNVKVTRSLNETNSSILIIDDMDDVCQKMAELAKENPVAIILNISEIQKCKKRKVPVFLATEYINTTLANISFEEENTKLTYAEYSSRGPNDLGLLKPDLIAPSQFIISARAGNLENPLMSRSGTSMAAPFISGAATLIRQYLEEGYYLTGTKNESNKIEPTANLLRAILINTAIALEEKYEVPNFKTGFGVPKLDEAIIFANTSSKGYRFINNIDVSSNKHYTAYINIKEQGEIRVSMAFTDTPLDEESIIPLSADIDLIVVSPTGRIFYGNGKEETHSTIERVVIHKEESEAGKYEIHLYASTFITNNTISVSVIASGPLNHTDTQANPKELRFIDEGIHKRVCRRGKTGVLCEEKTTELVFNENISFTLKEREWQYFTLHLPPLMKNKHSVIINVKKYSDTSNIIPSITIGNGEMPKYNGEPVSHFMMKDKNELQIQVKRRTLKTKNSVLYIGVYPVGNDKCNMSINVLYERKENIVFYVFLCLIIAITIVTIVFASTNGKQGVANEEEQNEYLITEKNSVLP